MPDETPAVTDDTARQRYEIALDGHVAFLTYRRRGDSVLLLHTEVPPAFQGRGFGQLLASHALNQAREDGQEVIVKCPFVTRWLERHPEYDDIVVARVQHTGEIERQPRDPR
ncbi:MAG TPA: GNAT family N-acetyltransferase [Gemmatimonadaceae bacterium]